MRRTPVVLLLGVPLAAALCSLFGGAGAQMTGGPPAGGPPLAWLAENPNGNGDSAMQAYFACAAADPQSNKVFGYGGVDGVIDRTQLYEYDPIAQTTSIVSVGTGDDPLEVQFAACGVTDDTHFVMNHPQVLDVFSVDLTDPARAWTAWNIPPSDQELLRESAASAPVSDTISGISGNPQGFVFFGGLDVNGTAHNDLVFVDENAKSVQVLTASFRPPARFDTSLVLTTLPAPLTGYILFGGISNLGQALNDVWFLQGNIAAWVKISSFDGGSTNVPGPTFAHWAFFLAATTNPQGDQVPPRVRIGGGLNDTDDAVGPALFELSFTSTSAPPGFTLRWSKITPTGGEVRAFAAGRSLSDDSIALFGGMLSSEYQDYLNQRDPAARGQIYSLKISPTTSGGGSGGPTGGPTGGPPPPDSVKDSGDGGGPSGYLWIVIIVAAAVLLCCLLVGVVVFFLYRRNRGKRGDADTEASPPKKRAASRATTSSSDSSKSEPTSSKPPRHGRTSSGRRVKESRGRNKAPVTATAGASLKMVTDVEVGRKIGAGSFGDVYRGSWQGTTDVALKALKGGPQELREFAAEAQTLQKLDHPRVVRFFGVFAQRDGASSSSSSSSSSTESSGGEDFGGISFKRGTTFYMVTEFMSAGAVNSLLQEKRDEITTLHLMDMALDTAAGMKYLESVNIVHRDLSARNLLAQVEGKSGYVVKVADFGLSRSDYYSSSSTGGSVFPVKWSPPEVIEFERFSSASDVFSFGVTMWEIMSYGRVPWMGKSNSEAMQIVLDGGRLSRPESSPDPAWDLMQRCWNAKARDRPTFEECFTFLKKNRALMESESMSGDSASEGDINAPGDGAYASANVADNYSMTPSLVVSPGELESPDGAYGSGSMLKIAPGMGDDNNYSRTPSDLDLTKGLKGDLATPEGAYGSSSGQKFETGEHTYGRTPVSVSPAAGDDSVGSGASSDSAAEPAASSKGGRGHKGEGRKKRRHRKKKVSD